MPGRFHPLPEPGTFGCGQAVACRRSDLSAPVRGRSPTSVRCGSASEAFLSVQPPPAGLSVRAVGAGGPELRPTRSLLSVDPSPGPVRYLSVTIVTTSTSTTADGTS
jgi:hypothetical protein